MTLLEQSTAISDELISYRRTLHKNAEIGRELPITTQFVKEKLTEMGIEIRNDIKTGVAAVIGRNRNTAINKAKNFLLRADMDALQLTEKTDLPFKCENGNMHACGHDFHAAMLLGAARLLKANEPLLDGAVTLMFQPDEEGLTGAQSMIDEGILASPKPTGALALHVSAHAPDACEPGSIYFFHGASTASCDKFRINVYGKGGHGASPENTIDPINVAAHILISLQTINAREHSASKPLALTVGKLSAGDACNIIPESAVMDGTLRTFDAELRKFAKNRIVEIAEFTAKAFGATAQVEFLTNCPSIENDSNAVEFLKSATEKSFKNVFFSDIKFMGSEDFSLISERIPSAHVWFAANRPEAQYNKPLHNPEIDFNENVLHIGAAFLANAALQWCKA